MDINFTKKTFLILTLVWIIITFNLIKSTYAKYVSELETNTNISISRWDISLNNQDIIENSNISDVLSLELLENEYAKNNVIVPGSIGYIDLNIDSSNTNIDFTTNIDISFKDESILTEDFIIFGYVIVNNENEITDNTQITEITDEHSSSLSCDISKDSNNTLIRIYVAWEDDRTDSTEDTSVGISNGMLSLNINLNFEQKIIEDTNILENQTI